MNTLEEDLTKTLKLLIHHPSAPDLLKALVTDVLPEYKIKNIEIFSLNSQNVPKTLFSYGQVSSLDQSVNFEKLLDSLLPDSNLHTLTESKIGIDRGKGLIVIPISNGNVLKGLIIFDLEPNQISTSNLTKLDIIGKLCAFYLLGELTELKSTNKIGGIFNEISLSARQIQIIQGFIEGKTNHEMGADLGFSVSTIRHETMDIFKLLGAADRKEAAKIAQENHIV